MALDEDWYMATPNEAIVGNLSDPADAVGNPVNLIATNDNLAYANKKQLEELETELQWVTNYKGLYVVKKVFLWRALRLFRMGG